MVGLLERRRGTILAALLLALSMGAGLWPLIRGEALPTWDANVFYAPSQMLVADHARQGKLLTWNPWLSAGRPDHADPQVGAASPLNVGIGLLTGGHRAQAHVAYWLLLWWLGGCGVLLLARHLGAPGWAGLVGALAFLGCGFNTSHGQHTTVVVSFALLPWLLWRLDVALRRASLVSAFQAGALLGLCGLSGYPGMLILHALFGSAWALGRLVGPVRRMPREALRTAFKVGCGVGVVTLVVLSPTYGAYFSEGGDYGARINPLDKKWVVERGSLSPESLAAFVSPQANVLRMERQEIWPGVNISLAGLYLFPGVLCLVILGLAVRTRDPWWIWLLVLGLLCLAATLGRHLPVRSWIYELVPLTRFFRFPAIFRAYWLFALILLAFEACRGVDFTRRRPWGIVAGGSLILGTLAFGVAMRLWGDLGEPLEWAGWTGWMAVAWFGPAALGGAAMLGSFRLRRLLPAGLILLALLDTTIALGISRPLLSADREALLRIWGKLEANHQPSLDLLEAGHGRTQPSGERASRNRNTIIKEPRFFSYDPFRNPYHRAWNEDEVLRSFVLGEDRVWFAAIARVGEAVRPGAEDQLKTQELDPTEAEGYRPFAARARELGAPILLIHPATGQEPIGPTTEQPVEALPPMLRIPNRILSYTPEHLALEVTAPADGWLMVTERYSKSWRATVDGQPSQLLKADFLFRAVPIPAGRHFVEFRYRPTVYYGLVALSWLVLAGILLLSFLHRKRP